MRRSMLHVTGRTLIPGRSGTPSGYMLSDWADSLVRLFGPAGRGTGDERTSGIRHMLHRTKSSTARLGCFVEGKQHRIVHQNRFDGVHCCVQLPAIRQSTLVPPLRSCFEEGISNIHEHRKKYYLRKTQSSRTWVHQGSAKG